MRISQIDIDYIKQELIPNVTFENVGKPCNLFNCVQVESLTAVRKMWKDRKHYSVDNQVWGCASGVICADESKLALRQKEIGKIQEMSKKYFFDNPVVKKVVRNDLDFAMMTGQFMGMALEWIAYGDNPKYIWFRSMAPIFLAGHLVCGFAGKKKKMYFGYRPEPVYYIY